MARPSLSRGLAAVCFTTLFACAPGAPSDPDGDDGGDMEPTPEQPARSCDAHEVPTGGAAPAAAVVGQSVQSGDWSSPSTWKDGRVPGADDHVIISAGHTVVFDAGQTRVAGIEVQDSALLRFAPELDGTLESSENIIVEGTLELRPCELAVVHDVRFVDVDESAFEGGGIEPLATDVGLWIMGHGSLDASGIRKTSWTRLTGSLAAGETTLTVERDPVAWAIGDEIVVVPTDTPEEFGGELDDATGRWVDPFHAKFERRRITAIAGSTITVDAPLAFAHDEIVSTDGTKRWTAEVANLTRNVVIEGTDSGRAHVFIHAHHPSLVEYVEGRYLGPRQRFDDTARTQLVLGRYALHFHHSEEGSRGSLVRANAFHDIGNRVYVPHASHGITMEHNVAFNSLEAAFWWDFQEITHDTTWDGNLVALVSRNGVNSSTTGMQINMGDGNVAKNNVVVFGHSGDAHTQGGYEWMADSEGIWTFENNLAHSNVAALNVWQNTSFNHTIVGYESYNNVLGVFHGAYGNSYGYTNNYHYNSPVEVKASSGNSNGVVFYRSTFDAGGGSYPVLVHDSPIPGVETNKFIECDFTGYTGAGVHLYSSMPDSNIEKTFKRVDLIRSTFSGEPFVLDDGPGPVIGSNETYPLKDGNRIRVQPVQGQAYQVEVIGGEHVRSTIEPFAPAVWGDGTGLAGEYYNGSDFNTLAFERLDSVIMFSQWSIEPRMAPFGVHHLVAGDQFSMRWTGHVEAQRSEPTTFHTFCAGGTRIWIDGLLILDSPSEKFDATEEAVSLPVSMVAGQKYEIRFEHQNQGGKRGCLLNWKTPSLDRPVFIPQSQVYPPQ